MKKIIVESCYNNKNKLELREKERKIFGMQYPNLSFNYTCPLVLETGKFLSKTISVPELNSENITQLYN